MSQTPTDGCKALYVGNLDPRVTEDMLTQIFSVIAPVGNVKIIRDRNVSKVARRAIHWPWFCTLEDHGVEWGVGRKTYIHAYAEKSREVHDRIQHYVYDKDHPYTAISLLLMISSQS